MRFESKIVPQVDRLSAAFEHSITWEDDLWRTDPVDVEAIHAPARRKFAELLDAVTAERSSAGEALRPRPGRRERARPPHQPSRGRQGRARPRGAREAARSQAQRGPARQA